MGLQNLITLAGEMPDYPVSKWQPHKHGTIDIVIHADGRWSHEGSIIQRHKLVQLFSRLLAYRQGHYWLVTPVEQLQITVEQLPFIIISAQWNKDAIWCFTTQVGDQVMLERSEQWQWLDQQPKVRPQLLVRDDLWANLSRQVYYDIALEVEPVSINQRIFGQFISANQSFLLGSLEE